MRALLHSLAEFLLPSACLCCGATLGAEERVACASCRAGLPRLDREHPLHRELRARLSEEGLVDDLFSAFVFEEKGCLQAVLHRLKYQGAAFIGAELGRAVAPTLPARLITGAAPLLVPVPLHRSKLRERGYNQSLEIGRGIAAATGLRLEEDLLVRARPTPSQTPLSRAERRTNVAGAFAVRALALPSLSRRPVLLVDDVITTGATVTECARVLRSAGAAPVFACSVALAA